jgi:hypothetical protein
MKALLAAILAIAAIAFVANRLQTEEPLSGADQATHSENAAGAGGADSAPGSATALPESAASGAQAPDEAIDPHKYIEDPEQVSVSMPVIPVPDQSSAARRDAEAASAPGTNSASGPGGPGGAPGVAIPAGQMVQGPVALEDAGPPPESGSPRIVGTGPGGEQSGIEGIQPVELGPEFDPTTIQDENVDLGPAPEASDPGSMGPAPEDSGG